MLNEVTLIGNLGQDPDLRQTNNGTSVMPFSLATEDRIKKGGQWQKETDWHRCVAWAKSADTLAQYTRKGSKLWVRGKLKTRKFQDQSGQDRFVTEVIVDQFKFLDPPPSRQQAPQGQQFTEDDISF